MSKESKLMSREIQKALMMTSRHLRSLFTGKLKDEDSQKLLIEALDILTDLNNCAFDVNENKKSLDKIQNELLRLQNKLPKKVLAKLEKSNVEELIEEENENRYDEDEYENEEDDEEETLKNPHRDQYRYEFENDED